MKIIYTCFIVFMITETILAQDTLLFYFDKDWKEIQNKDAAVFYRKAFMNNQDIWEVKDFYISDKLQMTGTFKSKKLEIKNGHFVYYYENGQKQSEGDYINNKREGSWTHWYENGQADSKGNFKANFLEGIWAYYHENGTKSAEGKYLKNYKYDLWKYWYPSGVLRFEEDFKYENFCNSTGYAENGKMISKGDFNNGKRQGEWTFYNVDGRLYLKGKYNNGLMEGDWIRYFSEGNMKIVYSKGYPVGKNFGGIVPRE